MLAALPNGFSLSCKYLKPTHVISEEMTAVSHTTPCIVGQLELVTRTACGSGSTGGNLLVVATACV